MQDFFLKNFAKALCIPALLINFRKIYFLCYVREVLFPPAIVKVYTQMPYNLEWV